MEKRNYGPHLMLDLGECDLFLLDDLDFCFNLLSFFPEKIGMQKITAPYVFRYKGKVPEERGITGFVVIAESHISLHTYPEKGFVFLDVFSCKNFDTDLAEKFLKAAFKSRSSEKFLVERGEHFPKE